MPADSPATVTRTRMATPTLTGWPVRLGVSVGLAGFLGLMGAVSFPLPWTPVPFSMMPFALLVTGAMQRPGYAGLSVALYLLAAGAGAPIFAGGESGWHHFVGATAGYLVGFAAASIVVSWYLQRPRRLLSGPWLALVGGFLGAAVLAGIGAILWMWRTGDGLAALDPDVASSWGVARSTLWFLLFLTVACTAMALALLARNRGERPQALNLFLVMLGSIVILHAFGVTVLWLATSLSLLSAIVLGSLVFLPFDIVKAGLAVGLTLPFLPSGRAGGAPANEEPHV